MGFSKNFEISLKEEWVSPDPDFSKRPVKPLLSFAETLAIVIYKLVHHTDIISRSSIQVAYICMYA
jgi:hypothetical protein